jgi:protease I
MKAVIITAQGFQDEEFCAQLYGLQQADIEVDVATLGKQVVTGKFGVPARPTIDAEFLTPDDATEFDAVLLPGGFEGPDRVRMIPEVLEFIWQMQYHGKLIAAICHAGSILISAGITKGRRMTGYPSIKQDIINSGAEYVQEDVVVDGNLITAPHYNQNGPFLREVVKWLQAKA